MCDEECFIEKAKKLHGDKFNYNFLIYENLSKKCYFVCNKCDITFKQKPTDHLRTKGGCPSCKSRSTSKRCNNGIELFKAKAFKTHGDRYDYTETIYINCKEKVSIRCKEHGIFYQLPNDHIRGRNCNKCAYKGNCSYTIINAERNKEEWLKIPFSLYFIKLGDFLKIGISENYNKRFYNLKKESGLDVEEIIIINSNKYEVVTLEQQIIQQIKGCSYLPNVKFTGYTECFNLSCKNTLESKIKFFTKYLHI